MIFDFTKHIIRDNKDCMNIVKYFFLNKNFNEMKTDMDLIAGRYLEISNTVTNQQLGGANLEYDSAGDIIGVGLQED